MREGLQPSHVQPRWRPAHDVIWCRCAELTVAMSIGAGRYLTLSGLAHHLWPHLVAGADGASLCGAIRADRGLQPSQALERDVAALLSELERLRLIHVEDAAPARNAEPDARHPRKAWIAWRVLMRFPLRDMPGRVMCFAALYGIHVCLRLFGLRPVLKRVLSPRRPSVADGSLREWLVRLATRIDEVAVWYPFDARCLERSLCLILLAGTRGVTADLRLGVLPVPFMAHAWVEHGGTPVNDTPEHLRMYVSMQPIGPEMVA